MTKPLANLTTQSSQNSAGCFALLFHADPPTSRRALVVLCCRYPSLLPCLLNPPTMNNLLCCATLCITTPCHAVPCCAPHLDLSCIPRLVDRPPHPDAVLQHAVLRHAVLRHAVPHHAMPCCAPHLDLPCIPRLIIRPPHPDALAHQTDACHWAHKALNGRLP